MAAAHLDVDPDRLLPGARLGEDLCVDSLDAVELTMVLEDEFDIALPDDVVADVRTYGDIVSLVRRERRSRAPLRDDRAGGPGCDPPRTVPDPRGILGVIGATAPPSSAGRRGPRRPGTRPVGRARVRPMPLPPPLSPEARQKALDKAAAARRQRAELKDKLKMGSLTLKELIDQGDNDEVVGKMKVLTVLESLPGVGRCGPAG